MIAYRFLYVRARTEYLRWKAEKPNQVASSWYDRYTCETTRKTRSELSYDWFRSSRGQGRKTRDPAWAWAWLGMLTVYPVYKGINAFCNPEVKVPDVTKIKKLELEDL